MAKTVSKVEDKVLPRKVRVVIYAVFFTACIVLVVLGRVTEDQVGQWLSWVGALLGVPGFGLALANRPKAIGTISEDEQ